MPALTFTDANAVVTDLNDDVRFSFLGIDEAGLAPAIHRTVRPPTLDYEEYVDSLLDPRLLVVRLALIGTSFSDLQTSRRNLAKALNPKLGKGTLKYTPVGASPVYAIDCVLEDGAGLGDYLGPKRERAVLVFRCFDPTWYNPTLNQPTLDVPNAGLSVPLTIPMGIGERALTATINNTGDVTTYPTITVPGPFDDPRMENVTASEYVELSGLSVLTGETLTVDMRARTAKVGTTSAFDRVTSPSKFWGLAKGNNSIKVSTRSGDPIFTVKWYERFIGV